MSSTLPRCAVINTSRERMELIGLLREAVAA
jgi:hypothetical protein